METNAEKIVAALETAKIEPELLCEIVVDAAKQVASNANNGGLEAQVKFLLNNGWEPEDIFLSVGKIELLWS